MDEFEYDDLIDEANKFRMVLNRILKYAEETSNVYDFASYTLDLIEDTLELYNDEVSL